MFQDYTLSNTQINVSAFTDSVDSTTTYTKGICGEKTVTLGASTPSFLSVTVGTDPINDDLVIVFD